MITPYGGSGGGDDWLSQLMGQSQKLNPLALGLQMGGGVVEQIAKWLGGGQQRADQSFGRKGLKGLMGKDVLNPSQIVGQKKLSYLQNIKEMAGGANRRLGLNSGEAYGELAYRGGMQEGNDLAELIRMNEIEKSRRDQQIAAMFYGAGG
jgi:hypothetical protein